MPDSGKGNPARTSGRVSDQTGVISLLVMRRRLPGLIRAGRPRARAPAPRLGGPDSNRDLTAPKAGGLPITPPPKRHGEPPRRYYDARVPEPTVVILAAGEGTRMRSAVPKVLHPLCGRPLIAWPVQAARDAGAGRVIVVDNPKRRLEEHLPDGVEVAIQEEPRGTGDAVAAAASLLDPTATVVVINGDVALLTAEAIKAADRRARGQRSGGDDGDDGARRAGRLRARHPPRRRLGPPCGRGQGRRRRRDRRAARDPRGQHRRLRLRRRRAGRRPRHARHRQRPGRAVPARRAARHARGRAQGRGPQDRRPRPHPRRRRPRRPRVRPAGRPAPHPRGAHAQRRHHRRPRLDPDRRHGEHRPRHRDRAVRPAQGRHDHRQRHASSAR